MLRFFIARRLALKPDTHFCDELRHNVKDRKGFKDSGKNKCWNSECWNTGIKCERRNMEIGNRNWE
jgi:hypothetical protein